MTRALQFIVRLLLLASPSPASATRLSAWSGGDLTPASAARHLAAARTAACMTGTSAYLLLYIAHHESDFRPTMRTREPGGKFSCGLMTPVPMTRCVPGIDLLEQYLAGAEHLRGWLVACRGRQRCALLGYAGGYALIRACARRASLWRWRRDRRYDICSIADEYARGAAELAALVIGGSS